MKDWIIERNQRLDQQSILLRQVQFIVNLNHPRHIIRKHPPQLHRRCHPPQPPRAGHGEPRQPVPLPHPLPRLEQAADPVRAPPPEQPEEGVAAHCHCHRCTNRRRSNHLGNLETAATFVPRNPRRNRLPQQRLSNRSSSHNRSLNRSHSRFEQPDLPDFVPLRWLVSAEQPFLPSAPKMPTRNA